MESWFRETELENNNNARQKLIENQNEMNFSIEPTFKLGVKKKLVGPKLSTRFIGPFVVKQISPSGKAYKLESMDQVELEKWVNVRRLKIYKTRSSLEE